LTLSYQGRLTDATGTPVPDGTRPATFRIFDAETGGTELWAETISATVSGGVISVILGNSTPIDLKFDQQYWLEVQIEGQTLQPRVKLTSAPYAMNSARVGGFEATASVSPQKILVLDGEGKFPNEALKTGHSRGLDADTVDGSHMRDIIVRTRAAMPGIRIEKYAFTDLNGETGEYTHVTNGRVGVLVESGYGAVTWAMNSQTVVEGQCIHCIDWEPYTGAYGQYFGPYVGNPNPELAKHRNNSAGFTLLDRVRYYKDEAAAMSDSVSGELNPLLVNKSTEKVVFMHRHILYPFKPVGNKYPAIQLVSPSGNVVGWGSTSDPSEYGGGTPDLANAVRCGWDGTSENLVGIVFDWNEEPGWTDAQVARLNVYVHYVQNPSNAWSLQANFFPAYASRTGATRSIASTSLPEGGWLAWDIPLWCLRKGTNCLLLRTTGTSSGYVMLGAAVVQTGLLKKNYMLTHYEPGLWDNYRRVSEYFVVYRDSDRIKTWARVDKGSDVTLDFVGGSLGDHYRRTSAQLHSDLAKTDLFPRGFKRLVSPTRIESLNFGTKAITDPGWTPDRNGWYKGLSGPNDPFAGRSGEDRWIKFSRDGAYPVRYVLEDPGLGLLPAFRLSSWNDFYAGGSGPDDFTADPLGYSKSWTDSPCGSVGLVPAGTRTATVTYDYTEF